MKLYFPLLLGGGIPRRTNFLKGLWYLVIRKSRTGWHNPTWGPCNPLLDIWVPSVGLQVPLPSTYEVFWTVKYPWKKRTSKGLNLDVPCLASVHLLRRDFQHSMNLSTQPKSYVWYTELWHSNPKSFEIPPSPKEFSFFPSWSRNLPIPSPLGWIIHPLVKDGHTVNRSRGVNSNGEIGDEYYEVVGRPRSSLEVPGLALEGES